MQILIITYSYTPELTPRAFRLSAVAAELTKSGHQVHVLCAAAPSLGVKDTCGVTVYRVRDWLIDGSARVTPASKTSSHVSAHKGGAFLYDLARKAIRAIWRQVYWPDFACGWVIPAACFARKLRLHNNYDWIISSSHPFTGHVVGMLALLNLPSLRWLVDISDPYSDMKEPLPNNRRIFAWLNRLTEWSVLARADSISVTTDATRKLYETSFTCSRGKVLVIPPMLTLPQFPKSTSGEVDTTIRLVFIGTLYRDLRSPEYLLSCLLALKRVLPDPPLELHFYGSINDCSDYFTFCPDAIKPMVFVHGLCTRERVAQAMVDADILVNIGNNSEEQLASKVVEYMSVGKPVLNIISIKGDVSIAELEGYPAKLTIMRSHEAPSEDVIEAIRSFVLKPPPVDRSCVNKIRSRYSTKRIAGLYESILLGSLPRLPKF